MLTVEHAVQDGIQQGPRKIKKKVAIHLQHKLPIFT